MEGRYIDMTTIIIGMTIILVSELSLPAAASMTAAVVIACLRILGTTILGGGIGNRLDKIEIGVIAGLVIGLILFGMAGMDAAEPIMNRAIDSWIVSTFG